MAVRHLDGGEHGKLVGGWKTAGAIRRWRARRSGEPGPGPEAGLRAAAQGASAGPVAMPHAWLLFGSVALSIGLCVWGTVGWRRAYRAQSRIVHLTWAEKARDAQLLRIVMRGGEAAAQMELEGRMDALPPEFPAAGE